MNLQIGRRCTGQFLQASGAFLSGEGVCTGQNAVVCCILMSHEAGSRAGSVSRLLHVSSTVAWAIGLIYMGAKLGSHFGTPKY